MAESDSFNKAFDRVFAAEGGHVNDPRDPGGETKYGISKRSYPHVDIKALTREDAKNIYRRDFWTIIHADDLPFAVAFQAFDFAVNSGPSTAVRYLQRALGVADDGYWGPVSQTALAFMPASKLLALLLAERLDFMTRCSAWDHDGKGWARRIAQDMRLAVADVELLNGALVSRQPINPKGA